jgi:hypothetical protein
MQPITLTDWATAASRAKYATVNRVQRDKDATALALYEISAGIGNAIHS